MRTKSIGFRLTAWYAGVLTAVVVILASLLFLNLKGYLEGLLENTQLRRAVQIADTLIAGKANLKETAIGPEISFLYAPEKSDRFIRVTRPDGQAIYTSGIPNDRAFDPGAVPPAPVQSGLAESMRKQPVSGGPDLLIASALAEAPGRQGRYLVEVGTSAAPVEALFRHLLIVLGLGLPVVVALAAAGGYALVRRALKPVDEITDKAAQITQHNMGERLPVAATGDEIERLSTALNNMIVRLDDAFQNSKRFVADASHELRTPLTVLSGELEELAQDKALSVETCERIGSLLEEVARLVKIVERLFALSRLDAGEAQAEWMSVDLASLASSTAEQMMLMAEDTSISMSCNAPSPVMVAGDPSRLKQVVVNLLDNAIKYTPQGGSVQIIVRQEKACGVLEVCDTGIGIDESDLPHVFERFFRADKARSKDREGAGLGLSIVKSICQAHNGTVTAESDKGRGSRFILRLPVAQGAHPGIPNA